ncbi:hypothetical protein [Planctomicrobium sp. SH664]
MCERLHLAEEDFSQRDYGDQLRLLAYEQLRQHEECVRPEHFDL